MSTATSPYWCHDNELRQELEQVIQEALAPVAKSGNRKRQGGVTRKAIQDVVQGFWLVAIGLKYANLSDKRRAFLVESVQLDEAKCRKICRGLGIISGVDHVTTWYETTTASAFAVDFTLMLEWLRGAKGLKGEGPSSKDTVRIDMSKPDLPRIQPGFRRLPYYILKENDSESYPGLAPIVVSLNRPEEFPELAGALLEYPVVYASATQKPGGGTYLDGAPLILVRVWLTRDGVQIEQLLSFTYTQALAISLAKTLDIVGTLTIRYKERLRLAIESTKLYVHEQGLGVQVTTEAITLDRVVL